MTLGHRRSFGFHRIRQCEMVALKNGGPSSPDLPSVLLDKVLEGLSLGGNVANLVEPIFNSKYVSSHRRCYQSFTMSKIDTKLALAKASLSVHGNLTPSTHASPTCFFPSRAISMDKP